MVAFPKIEVKWDWVSDVHAAWRGNLILTLLSCENPWNIWELNYGPQICGANKLTGKMALVLRLHEWTSLFSHGTFQHYVFMLSTRFVRTSGINFNCLTKHEATLSTLDISRRNYCSGYDERAWHGCRYICRDIASRLCSQCIMDKISMSTPSRWRGNVVVYKCCFFGKWAFILSRMIERTANYDRGTTDC